MTFRKPTHLRTVRIVEILKAAWMRSRDSLSLNVVWVCSGLFFAAAILDLLGVVDRGTIYSFLGLSYYGIVQRLWIHQLVSEPPNQVSEIDRYGCPNSPIYALRASDGDALSALCGSSDCCGVSGRQVII